MGVQVRVRLASATRLVMQKLLKLSIDAIYTIPKSIEIVDDEDEIEADIFVISGKNSISLVLRNGRVMMMILCGWLRLRTGMLYFKKP